MTLALLTDDARRESEGRRLAEEILAAHGAERVSRLIAAASASVRRGAAAISQREFPRW